MVTQQERDELIANIAAVQHEMAAQFMHDRTMPLLASNLTMQQFKVLLLLLNRDDLAGHQLAEALGVKLGTVTGIVDRLVAQNLVRRFEDPDDRRVRRVSLTAEGNRIIQEMTDHGLAQFRELLGYLDTDDLRLCLHVTKVLRDAAVEWRRS